MLAAFVGKESYLAAVERYVRQYHYGNATSSDWFAVVSDVVAERGDTEMAQSLALAMRHVSARALCVC